MSTSTQTVETVLVVGSTGNIGIAAIQGALRAGYNVLAPVRNQDSANKLTKHIASGHERITTVVADVVSDTGVQEVVDRVRAGSLPSFQHVYAAVGGGYTDKTIFDASLEELRDIMKVNFDANYLTYRATIPYLLEQKTKTTFTTITGSEGDVADRALPAISQGAMFSLAHHAAKTLKATTVRFNEVYLGQWVEVDSVAEQNGSIKSSVFAKVYEEILKREDLVSCRVWVTKPEDVDELRFVEK